MKRIQYVQFLSIFSAVGIGFLLPLRLLEFNLPLSFHLLTDFLVGLVSCLNIYLHFYEKDLSFRQLKNWISLGVALDLIALIPTGLAEFFWAGDVVSPLFLLNHLLATRHILRIKTFLDEFDGLPPIFYRLVPIFFTLPVIVHFVACGWISLGSGTAGPDPDKTMEYIKAVYWAFTTLTTVGYGDISAKTATQMLFTCGVQVVGVAVFGFILSNVASLIARMDAAREHHMDNIDKLETFMQSHHIPTDLRARVRGYFHFLWTNHKGYMNRTLLEGLPVKMKSELLFHINSPIISKVPIFSGASNDMIEDMMVKLEPAIYVPDEKIFRAGEDGDALYFVQSGQVDIQTPQGQHIASLRDGAFFGEMALISEQKRSATAVATSHCDIYRLPRESFKQVLQQYPDFKKRIEEVVNQRKSQRVS